MKVQTFILLTLLLFSSYFADAKTAKWTVLVYMNADNNLEPDGIDDFLEIAAAPNSEDVNVVVQFDRTPGYTGAYGDWTQTLRFRIKNGMTPTKDESVMDLGEKNMGDPKVFQDFITWGKKNYPADHYVIVFWGHGSGYRIKSLNFTSNPLFTAYLKEYNQSQGLINKSKKSEVDKQKAQFTTNIANLSQQENKALNNVNALISRSSMLQSSFITSVKPTANYQELYTKYKHFVSNKISKLSAGDLGLVDKVSKFMEALVNVDYKKKHLQTSFEYLSSSKSDVQAVTAENAEVFETSNDPVRSCSNDDTDHDFLFNKEIQDALKVNEADIVGFDACLMSMLETGYILKSKSAFLIGSEELEPGTGWNYTLWLDDLVKNPDMSPLYLSKSIVASYQQTYPFTSSVTLSCIDLSLIPELLDQLEILSQSLISKLNPEYANIKSARSNCLKYARDLPRINSIDLSLFLYQLTKTTGDTQLKETSNKIRSIINLMVVSNFFSGDHSFKENIPSFGSFGLAIYFPSDKLLSDEAYTDANTYYPIQFVRDYSWDNFLNKYLNH